MKMLKIVSVFTVLVMVLLVSLLPGLALAEDGEPPATDNTTATDNVTTTTDNVTTTTDNITTTTDNVTSPPPAATAEPEPEETEEPEVPPDTITMSTEFPKIEANATQNFVFNVELKYDGRNDRVFDLSATAPSGWSAYVTPQYDTMRISSISIESSYTSTTKNVKITVTPPSYPVPDPGEYKTVFEAENEDVVGEIELAAKIIAKYELDAVPANQRYNTKATAGRDNILSIEVTNTGSDTIDNITFSSDKPDGWEITFQPEKIDLLSISDPQSIDVNIKPPPRTVAGDYYVYLRVSGEQASVDTINIRVTVETPSIWGWVGVGIIVIVIVGLAVIFMRFGRR